MKNNILLVGPSGCGKTYIAKQMALKCDVLFLHFYDGSDYDTTIEGISVNANNGAITYKMQDKLVIEFVKRAVKNKNHDYMIILDDIHYVDLHAVLGELLYALKNHNSSVTLKSGNRISVPENVSVIATACCSDLQRTEWKRNISWFDEVRFVENTIDDYTDILSNRIKERSYNEEESKNILNVLKEVYLQYTHEYCRFTDEYLELAKELQPGLGYFLPSSHTEISDWYEEVQCKIKYQVLPLLWKYAEDGIIYKQFIPYYDDVRPNLVLKKQNENVITIAEESTGQFSEIEKDVFVNNCELPIGVPFRANTSQKVNYLYIALFSLVRDIIENGFFSSSDIINILTTDSDILTWRNDVYNTDTGKNGACLFVFSDISDRFSVRDAAAGNTKGSYAYSRSYHTLKYIGKEYRMFSAYDIRKRRVVCPYLIQDCIEHDRGTQKREFYKTAKMLAYKVLLKFKQLWILYTSQNMYNKENDKIMRQLQDDLSFIEHITDDERFNDEPFYINLKKENGDLDKQKAKQFILKIKNLPSWEFMRMNGGVFRAMINKYKHIMDLTGVHQMIFEGPPGTSKTYGAKKVIAELAGIECVNWEHDLSKYQLKVDSLGNYMIDSVPKQCYWDMVQLHPSYTYEDFVRGVSVYTIENSQTSGVIEKCNSSDKYDLHIAGNSTIGYKVVNKVIGKMAAAARKAMLEAQQANREVPCFVLLVDEINRANLATVLGELIYALEYRNEAVDTPYTVDGDSKLIIPDNMYIIGTMNTADKSIGNIDYAIRRRFLFFPMLPDINVVLNSIRKFNQNVQLEECIEVKLFYLINAIFDKCLNDSDYNRSDVQIGHTYFLRDSNDVNIVEERQKLKFIYQILPILAEYKKDGVLDFNSRNLDDDVWSEALATVSNMLSADNSKVASCYQNLVSDLGSSKVMDFIRSEINCS